MVWITVLNREDRINAGMEFIQIPSLEQSSSSHESLSSPESRSPMVKKWNDFQGCYWIQISTYDYARHKEEWMRSQEWKTKQNKLVALSDSLACPPQPFICWSFPGPGRSRQGDASQPPLWHSPCPLTPATPTRCCSKVQVHTCFRAWHLPILLFRTLFLWVSPWACLLYFTQFPSQMPFLREAFPVRDRDRERHTQRKRPRHRETERDAERERDEAFLLPKIVSITM